MTDEDIANALLQCGTVTKTAEFLEVNRCRLYKRVNAKSVQDILHKKREELFSSSCSRLIEASTDAIEVLIATMHDPETTAGQRIRACEVLLTNAYKSFELLDITNEIRELKQDFEEMKGRC